MTDAALGRRPSAADELFVLCADAGGRIEVWNEALAHATGFSEDEMLGHDAREIVPHAGELRLPLKAGGHRLARWSLATVDSGGKEQVFALGVDVTAERAARQRLLFGERAAAVAQLGAGLAHELRNPLNAALLELALLRSRAEGGALEARALLPQLETVEHEVRRVSQLLTDFLGVARPESLRLERVELNRLVQGVARRFATRARRLGVSLETELDPAVGAVELDARRIREALSFLIENALDAAGSEGQLRIRTRPANARGHVVVEVEDTGAGFPPDAPIFDAFYTTKHSRPGLGLAIVMRTAADHGGLVHAFREADCTRFVLELPQPRL